MKNMNEEFLSYNTFYVLYSEDSHTGNKVSYLIDLTTQNTWHVSPKWRLPLEY